MKIKETKSLEKSSVAVRMDMKACWGMKTGEKQKQKQQNKRTYERQTITTLSASSSTMTTIKTHARISTATERR